MTSSQPTNAKRLGRTAASAPLRSLSSAATQIGRAVAFSGIVLPLLLIGGLKFTAVEVEALRPLIASTPWLAWMYPVFGAAGASYILGVVEIAAAVLLIAGTRFPTAGVIGGTLASLTFLMTSSIMLTVPIWDPTMGFPALGAFGQFLIKDIALLGISLTFLGERADSGGRYRNGLTASDKHHSGDAT